MPVQGNFNPARDGPTWAAFFVQLNERLNAHRELIVGTVSSLPLTGAVESGAFRIDGQPTPAPGQWPSAQYAVVAGRYFEAMGIPLIVGRRFDTRDKADAPPVIIVNAEFARRQFPGENAIGKRIVPRFDFTGAPREIVGIIADIKQTALDADPAQQMYVPEEQMPYPFMNVVLRTAGDPATALPVLRRELRALDPSLALSNVRLIDEVFENSLARQRFSMVVIAVFAGAALALALVGLYGVIALSVGQRRREIGVRMALGARAIDVLRMVLGEGARLTMLGIAVGLVAAFGVMRVLRSLLYDVSTTDVTIYAGAAVLVAAVALLATYLPARRATRVDPTEALRT
jgi:predicted permease